MPRRRVLLNVASSELTLGGDSSHYRDYVQLSNEEVDFHFVPPSWIRTARTFTGRVAGRACRSWEPSRLRRWLFVHSKLRVIRDEPLLRQADAVFSHLWFPDFPPGRARPVIWSSQGISPAAYYAYVDAGRVSIDD